MRSEDKGPLGFTTGQWRLFTLVLVVSLALAGFYFLKEQRLHDSAALYVGLPLFFALAISLTAKAKTTVGATMKGLSIALFLSAPVFKEGFICILFASPILFIVAALVASLADLIKKKIDARSKVRLSAVVTVLMVASLEGTPYELYTFSDRYSVSYTTTVNKSVADIRANIENPGFSHSTRPLLLRVFPFPAKLSGHGLHVGAEHKVDFVYKKWIVTNVHEGSTVFRVVESSDRLIRFDIPHDTSYLSNYLTWNSSAILIEPIADGETRVTWTLDFTRDLDPAWYFGPLQTYAAWLTAKVLVGNATS